MKTTISLPFDLVERAGRVAHHLGISRSQLFVLALREYLAAHANEGLTEQINAVCEKVDASIDPSLRQAQVSLLRHEG